VAGPRWTVESLRLSFFTMEPMVGGPRTWWQEIVGEEPERRTALPRQLSWQDAGSFSIEEIHDAELTLHLEPGRVDWRLGPSASRQLSLATGETAIGHLDKAPSTFIHQFSKWLSECPPVKRLAFGSVLSYPVASREEGYQTFSSLLPINLGGDVSDFLYRINRRRENIGPGSQYLVNRLSTWAVVQVQEIALSLPATVPQATIQGTACRLELDINTAPERNPPSIPNEDLLPLLETFLELGKEIAIRGDIP